MNNGTLFIYFIFQKLHNAEDYFRMEGVIWERVVGSYIRHKSNSIPRVSTLLGQRGPKFIYSLVQINLSHHEWS